MNHAKETDFETVKEIFYQHKKWFPHIRTDYMKRMIAKDNLILDNDVVITYNFYKRKQKIGNVIAQQGDCILHQIAAKYHNGSASRVLQKFFEFVNPRRVFLSVRSDNEIAKKFYLKNNMKLVGTTSWARGTLPGDVYLYETS
jgi:RimJ/RimL family protein N-acetyltransferase|tara:strand:+ start:373 stop:801 length:429 start_codon:yes stop_codon:yes gene_type:complete